MQAKPQEPQIVKIVSVLSRLTPEETGIVEEGERNTQMGQGSNA
jgi:hypothetical protein